MEFPEIENYMIILPVTLNCNLNCYGCYTGCSIEQKNNYELDINTLDATLSKLVTICKHCDGFILTGGEPLLSKNFMFICQKLKEHCPNWSIVVYTNGTLLHTLSDSDLNYLAEKRITFAFSYYPDSKMLSQTIRSMTQLESKRVPVSLHDRSRPYFLKTTYNTENTDPLLSITQIDREIGCGHRREPRFTLMDNKIFGCDGALTLQNLQVPFSEQNYISINDLQNETQMYLLKHDDDMCLKCKNESIGQPYMIWHTQKELGVTNNEHHKNLMDIFCYEYEKYKKLQDDNERLIDVISNPYFDFGMVKYEPHYGYEKYCTRYLYGNVDICFVFNQKNMLDLEDLLHLKQKIRNFIDKKNNNLYIICNNLTLEQQKNIYITFVPSSNILNTYLIKCDSYQDGIKYFLNNSFSPYYCVCNNITVKDCDNFENILKNSKKRE